MSETILSDCFAAAAGAASAVAEAAAGVAAAAETGTAALDTEATLAGDWTLALALVLATVVALVLGAGALFCELAVLLMAVDSLAMLVDWVRRTRVDGGAIGLKTVLIAMVLTGTPCSSKSLVSFKSGVERLTSMVCKDGSLKTLFSR